MITHKAILIALYYQYDGDWDAMFKAIENKIEPDKDCLEEALKNENNYTTIMDNDYPEELKLKRKPPFVIDKVSNN